MSLWLDFKSPSSAPLVIGHRGAPETVLENTRVSHAHALEAGAASIEADVRLTADRECVCLHDPDLLRVAGVSANIDELSLSEARKLFPALFPLRDLLELTAGRPIIIDLKCTGADDLDRIVEACQAQDALGRILFTAHDVESGHAIRKRAPAVAIGAFFKTGADAFRIAGDFDASWIRVLPKDYSRETIGALQEAGFHAVAVAAPTSTFRTSTDGRSLSQIQAAGIDAIITDDPALAVRHFASADNLAKLQQA